MSQSNTFVCVTEKRFKLYIPRKFFVIVALIAKCRKKISPTPSLRNALQEVNFSLVAVFLNFKPNMSAICLPLAYIIITLKDRRPIKYENALPCDSPTILSKLAPPLLCSYLSINNLVSNMFLVNHYNVS